MANRSRLNDNLWRKSHKRVARSRGPRYDATPEQKAACEVRKRIRKIEYEKEDDAIGIDPETGL